jgi:hypothetical protein
MTTALRTTALALLLASGLALGGCYKADMEKEKARANAAEEKIKGLESELAKAKGDLQAAAMRAQQAEAQFRTVSTGAVLVTLVDGQPAGTDTIRFNGTSFVRHGERRRSNGSIQFDNGRLADGPFTMNRDNGKKWFEGAVRNSRPDGEWIWYNRDGQPSTRETWRDGKVVEVARGTTAKDGKTSWARMNKADRDAWFRSTANTFVNLPELIRDTTMATAAADPGTTSAGNQPAAKPATRPAPARPTPAPRPRNNQR